jgi:hypothetical protein
VTVLSHTRTFVYSTLSFFVFKVAGLGAYTVNCILRNQYLLFVGSFSGVAVVF